MCYTYAFDKYICVYRYIHICFGYQTVRNTKLKAKSVHCNSHFLMVLKIVKASAFPHFPAFLALCCEGIRGECD